MAFGKIYVQCVDGSLFGTKYCFEESMLCRLGRADDCQIRFSGPESDGMSRHHCLLDIRPPKIFIQDSGSSNGTFLNGENIGVEANDPGKPRIRREMFSGDRFQIGSQTFQIKIILPPRCSVCHRLIPQIEENTKDLERLSMEHILCSECRKAGLRQSVQAADKTRLLRSCCICGKNLVLPEYASPDLPEEACICEDCARRSQTELFHTQRQRLPETDEPEIHLRGYRILKKIARGGTGIVYLGQDERTLEKVAVKRLLPEIASDEDARMDFTREVQNLQQLVHPNIVRMKDCRFSEKELFLIMEYCSGGTLRDSLMERGSPFPLRTALDLTYQILDGLDYAHKARLTMRSLMDDSTYVVHGLVHRDVKPSNIYLSVDEGVTSAKIADFGIAKAFQMAGMSGCTRTGDFSGTLAFLPKQQFLNFKYVKPEVDVWAAAATLYYMLVGAPPRDFSGGDVAEVFEMLPYPVRDLNHEITPALAWVLDSALNDQGTLKYKTAVSLKIALMDAENK